MNKKEKNVLQLKSKPFFFLLNTTKIVCLEKIPPPLKHCHIYCLGAIVPRQKRLCLFSRKSSVGTVRSHSGQRKTNKRYCTRSVLNMEKRCDTGDTPVASRGRCPALPRASWSGNDCRRPTDENRPAHGRDDDESTVALTSRFRSSVSITLVAAAATTETTDVGTKTAAVVFGGQHGGLTPDMTAPTSAAEDDSDGDSSGEKGSCGGGARKDRKPLPLVFDRSNNDSSSDASEDAKETADNGKCVYLGEKETLRSFWDKCLYECFKSKRCVAGEKPKRKYRKKPKVQKQPPTKKRKQQDAPFSCIDTSGTAAVTRAVG